MLRQNVSTEQLVSAESIDIRYFKPGESVKQCISFAELSGNVHALFIFHFAEVRSFALNLQYFVQSL